MKGFVTILLLGMSLTAFCQKKSAEELIRTAADLKTGRSQDVLISFFQLALNDITGDQKTFHFQSSLFAIKAKTDTTLFVDTNFLRQTLARNFVFSIAPSLDTNWHFSSNKLGLKYALINNRDKALFDFVLPDEAEWLSIQRSLLNEYARRFPDGVRNPKYLLARNFFADKNDEEIERTSWSNLPEDFKKMFRAALASSRTFRLTTPQAFRDTLAVEYSALARYVENRSLWTVSADVKNERRGRFSALGLQSQFLKGMLKENSRMNLELDLQGAINFDQDTSKNSRQLKRQLCSFAGGCNWIILKNRRSQSLLELRAAVLWNKIIRGRYAAEKSSQFTGEGTIRLRLANDWWIPVDIRYDPVSGNLFGFLSVRTNFDWLGK